MNMFSFLLSLFLAQTVTGRCTISGTVCSFQSLENETVSGICVPLDSSGVSQDCNNVYGFIVDNTQCEGYDANVRHFLPVAWVLIRVDTLLHPDPLYSRPRR
jgi:hypothetical protein